ncbi:MAG: hypothetical protein K5672_02460 [Bacteroidaceae bacterium]|nr:hypothetical protein [Bacteroidaceae bacterium]
MEEEVKIQESTGMVINESMKADLLSSAKWAKFLCILSCIGLVFLLAMAVCMFAFGSTLASLPGMAGFPAVMGVSYLICIAIMIYPIIKGFQFANGVKAACLTNSEAELARGFAGMQGYLQYMGILAIIALVIYGLLLIGIFAVAGIAASAV